MFWSRIVDEDESDSSGDNESDGPPSGACRFYYYNGHCRFGDQCRYDHVERGQDDGDEDEDESDSSGDNESDGPPSGACRFYYYNGHCRFGDQCRYDHVERGDGPDDDSSAAGSLYSIDTTDWEPLQDDVPVGVCHQFWVHGNCSARHSGCPQVHVRRNGWGNMCHAYYYYHNCEDDYCDKRHVASPSALPRRPAKDACPYAWTARLCPIDSCRHGHLTASEWLNTVCREHWNVRSCRSRGCTRDHVTYENFPPLRQGDYDSSEPSDSDDHVVQQQVVVLPQRPLAPAATVDVRRPNVSRVLSHVASGMPGLDDTCSVCLLTYGAREEICLLSGCGHKFHRGCLQLWFNESSKSCPNCRGDVVPTMPPRAIKK
eukprot:PhM_4_TR5710/c0_g1_i1/m.42283